MLGNFIVTLSKKKRDLNESLVIVPFQCGSRMWGVSHPFWNLFFQGITIFLGPSSPSIPPSPVMSSKAWKCGDTKSTVWNLFMHNAGCRGWSWIPAVCLMALITEWTSVISSSLLTSVCETATYWSLLLFLGFFALFFVVVGTTSWRSGTTCFHCTSADDS